jgi:hypothetical protein
MPLCRSHADLPLCRSHADLPLLGVALSLSFHFQKGKKRNVKTFLS